MEAIETQVPSRPYPEAFVSKVQRLNRASVTKGHPAFTAIDWDAPENQITPKDTRFALNPTNPLAQTAWYQALDETTRATLGLAWGCQLLKNGIAFESVLTRGIIEYALSLEDRDPCFRYAFHEVIEECHHSLMFQELINRAGESPKPLAWWEDVADRWIIRKARTFPELFFFSVLAGEIFIDYSNRLDLTRPDLHPAMREVLRIHVMEEARHVSFAKTWLEEKLPQLGAWKRLQLKYLVPLIFSDTARLMMTPPTAIVKRFQIPKTTVKEAFGKHTPHEETVIKIVEPIYALSEKHGLIDQVSQKLWRQLQLV